ncbi:hypothetical protein GQ54DRAFT_339297 [Martensiomyces pterosporus]|nr:hypothetical protein GQ54DRAFT_339297 [Martensiomyces pterosporus]
MSSGMVFVDGGFVRQQPNAAAVHASTSSAGDSKPRALLPSTATSVNPAHRASERQGGHHSTAIPYANAAGAQPLGNRLRAPPPVIYSSMGSGHKRMSSAPPGNLTVPSQAAAYSGTGAPYPPALQPARSVYTAGGAAPAAGTRPKRASTFSTVDHRMHSLLITDDQDPMSMAPVPSSQWTDSGLPNASTRFGEFPRWGDAPSISSFMATDKELEFRSPYMCHSASRSIGSKRIECNSTATHSSTTLWQPAFPKSTHMSTPVITRSSNERSYVVPVASEKYEWRASWDVI